MDQLITGGLVGSLVTIIIKVVLDSIKERTKHKRALSSLVFKRKLDVVEKSMSWMQESVDAYCILKVVVKEYIQDDNINTRNAIVLACGKLVELFQEAGDRLNGIYLYYDFHDIEQEYCMLESVKETKEMAERIVSISQGIDAKASSENVETEIKKFIDPILSEIDNQVRGTMKIQQRLRDDYKAYLKKV